MFLLTRIIPGTSHSMTITFHVFVTYISQQQARSVLFLQFYVHITIIKLVIFNYVC